MAKKAKNMEMKWDKVMIVGATLSVVFAAVGYTGTDIWLASTQWLLVASVLALFGVYFKQK